jgi:hypothetical protein
VKGLDVLAVAFAKVNDVAVLHVAALLKKLLGSHVRILN